MAPIVVETPLVPRPAECWLVAAIRLGHWLVQSPAEWRRIDAGLYGKLMASPAEPEFEAQGCPSFEQFRDKIQSVAQLARGTTRMFSFLQGQHSLHTIFIQCSAGDSALSCKRQPRWMWRYYRPLLRLGGWKYTGRPW